MGRSVWRRMTSYRRSQKFTPDPKIEDKNINPKLREYQKTDDSELREIKRQKSAVKEDNIISQFSGIPIVSDTVDEKKSRPGAIFIFENASLVLAKINKSYEIINPDEHAGFMRKHNLNRRDYRPDIIHEVLKRLLGRRLSMAGGIQAVYVKTIQGYLIKIEPNLSIPPTLKQFCAMMSQLLQNLSVKGTGRNKNRKLLKMIKNPVTMHLPSGSHTIGLSSTSSKGVNLGEYFDSIDNDRTLVFVIGAMAHGKIENEYADDFIAVSKLPLSARTCVSLICDELERQQGIL